jgi:hypothetical protein
MMTQRRGEFLAKPIMLGLTQRRRGFQVCLGLLAQGHDVLTDLKELLFGLANQFDEDLTLTPTATAEAAPNFGEVVFEDFHLLLQTCAVATALLGEASDEV